MLVTRQKFRVGRRQPLHEEVEAAPPTHRANLRTPPGPSAYEFAEPEEANDLPVRRMLEQPHRRPVAIEATEVQLARQQCAELALVDIVVPNVGEATRHIRRSRRSTGHEKALARI